MPHTVHQRVVALLRFSEKYTKTDMLYLTKGGFWLVVGRIVVLGSGLLLSVAYANLLPKETYGTYQYIMSFASIISVFTLTKMSTALTRSVAQGSEGALRYALRVQMTWSTGVVLAGAVVAAYYYLNGNNTLALSFLIVGGFYPLLAGFSLSQSYLLGKQYFRESVLLGFWRRLIPTLSLLGVVFLTHDPVIIVLVYFASNTLSVALLYWLVVKRYDLPYAENKEMVAYSKHLSLMAVVSGIVSQADDILIFHYLGAAALAIYTLALLPVQHIEAFFGLVGSLSFPKMAGRSFGELQQSIPRKARLLLAAAATIVVAYLIISPLFFHLLFPRYPEALLFSQALILLILAKPRTLYAQVFTTHGMKREQYITSIVSSSMRIALLLVLLPRYGIWGAVYALLGTQLTVNLLTRYLFAVAKSNSVTA